MESVRRRIVQCKVHLTIAHNTAIVTSNDVVHNRSANTIEHLDSDKTVIHLQIQTLAHLNLCGCLSQHGIKLELFDVTRRASDRDFSIDLIHLSANDLKRAMFVRREGTTRLNDLDSLKCEISTPLIITIERSQSAVHSDPLYNRIGGHWCKLVKTQNSPAPPRDGLPGEAGTSTRAAGDFGGLPPEFLS